MFIICNNVNATEYLTGSGIKIHPMLTATYGYDDNILKSSSNKESSAVLKLTPEINLELRPKDNKFIFKYKLQKANYFNSHEDDFIDHYISSENSMKFGIRNKIDLNINFMKSHDARGTGISAGDSQLSNSIDEPVFFTKYSIKPMYTYGANRAKGKLQFWGGYLNKRFNNFRELSGTLISDSTKYNDYDAISFGGKFLYKISQNTYLTITSEEILNNYKLKDYSNYSQDNVTKTIYTGAEWNVSGKTKGYVNIGIQDKKFHETSHSRFSGMSYKVGIRWEQTEYSKFNVFASQLAKDPELNGDYIESKNIDLSWHYSWTYHFFSIIDYKYSNDKYVGSYENGILRKEKCSNVAIGVGYIIDDNFVITLNNKTNRKKSTWNGYDYDQNIWSLNIKLGF